MFTKILIATAVVLATASSSMAASKASRYDVRVNGHYVGTDPDQRDYEVDYSKLRTVGFRATVGLEEGVQELIKVLSVLVIQHPLRNA